MVIGDLRDSAVAAERLWRRVSKLGDGVNDCWLWQGGRRGVGYGGINVPLANGERLNMGTHRFSYMLEHGYLPDDLDILHACDTPSCVRPSHLFAGTARDNSRDMAAKGRTAVRINETHPRCKITNAGVIDIRTRRALGVKCQVLANEYDVSSAYVSMLTTGICRRHVT